MQLRFPALFFIIFFTLHLVSCQTKKEQKITSEQLPSYEFEEFYKTIKIENFDFPQDPKGIYFLKQDGNIQNIFFYNFLTKKEEQISFEKKEAIESFKISPNGEFLIFSQSIGGSEIPDLFYFNLKTKEISKVTDGQQKEKTSLCRISKDNNSLYFTQTKSKRTYSDIKKINLKTKKIETIVEGKKQLLYCENISKDEKYLIFATYIENNENHLSLLNLKEKKISVILEEKGVKNQNPYFLKNNKVYFLSTKDSDIKRMWSYDLETKKLALVPLPLSNNLSSFHIDKEEKFSVLVYRSEFSSNIKIYKNIFEEEVLLPLPPKYKILNAGFKNSIGLVMAAPEGHPTEYFLWKDQKLEKFYDANNSKIKPEHFPLTQSLFVKSFDGLKIPVNLYLPPDTFLQKKKYPAIFWIHGGPESHDEPIYSSTLSFFVNQGFVVIAPNVRGSTGSGKNYQMLDNGDWGGGHIKDIVEVASYSKTLDFIDAKNLFLIGGSFGGFSVMSLITQFPTIFNAAVNIFGIVEMSSFIKSWPESTRYYWLSELGFDPEKDLEKNKKVSPLFHVQNIQIPLQIYQGANDIRVPKEQSDLLVAKLKEHKKQFEYFLYEDEGHGFTKFKNLKDVFTKSINFFKFHMKK